MQQLQKGETVVDYYSQQVGSTEYSQEVGSTEYSQEVGSTECSQEVSSTEYSQEFGSTEYSQEVGSTQYWQEVGSTEYLPVQVILHWWNTFGQIHRWSTLFCNYNTDGLRPVVNSQLVSE